MQHVSRFNLGLASLLADPGSEQPGGFYRDDLLAHLVEQIADETYNDHYELRELLSSDLPLSSDDGSQQGELLIMMRADKVGGPLARAEADRVLALVAAAGGSGELSAPFPFLHARTVIVPPICVNGPLRLADKHPLNCVFKLSAIAVQDNLGQVTGDVDRFRQVLALCIAEKLPISVVRA